jgi:hypothetical protein
MTLGHPAYLAEVRIRLDISVVYVPSKTTLLFQPMDQRVIATYYLCQTFIPMARVVDRSDKTNKDYWHSFNILKGINNIKAAWEEASANCSNGMWHKLLPEFMHDFTGYQPVENTAETSADWS